MSKLTGIGSDEPRETAIAENMRASFNTVTGKDDNQASSEARVADASKARRDEGVAAASDQQTRRGKMAVARHVTRPPTDNDDPVPTGPAYSVAALEGKVRA